MTSPDPAADPNGEIERAAASHRHRRAELRARLAAERAELFCSLLGMDVRVLESQPLQGTTSAAGLLSAVARREDYFAALLTRASDPSQTEVSEDPADDRIPLGFDEALERCVGARSRFLDALARLPDDALFDDSAECQQTFTPLTMATQCHWNDASLSLRASAWSRDHALGTSMGPVSLLRAAVRAARKDLLTTVALVPEAVRGIAIFEGGRSLPQIFHMILGLERTFHDHLARSGLAPSASRFEPAATENDTWEGTWSILHTTHAALIGALDTLDPTAYAAGIGDDGSEETVYLWARGCLLHDRLYAAHIRAVLELDWPERLLR
jgi:hypothetical protein